MSRDEVIAHWRKGARQALELAGAAHERCIYSLALFHCNLAVEKALKAAFIKDNDQEPPYTHNLVAVAQKLKRPWTKAQLNELAELSKYAVAARYDDPLWMEQEATAAKSQFWMEKARIYFSLLDV
ncbi:HEPN domain-containing protein [Candidatus Peregrinibacteria bacterium]|nr:HEPN domain-containing protein [Candidatus Peregrinibacteria bacterium]MBI3816799.1 HEPN domain-containing protein [Candidatus Peregrinibacteria bacterium]